MGSGSYKKGEKGQAAHCARLVGKTAVGLECSDAFFP